MIPPPKPEHLALLDAYEPWVKELVLTVRELVLEEAPGAEELLYDAPGAVATGYTFTERLKEMFIHIAAYERSVNLGFNRGSELHDPGCILRGDGMWIRHIRLSSMDDVERTFARRFVKEAVPRAKRPEPPAPAPVEVKRTFKRVRKPKR